MVFAIKLSLLQFCNVVSCILIAVIKYPHSLCLVYCCFTEVKKKTVVNMKCFKENE